MTAWTFSGYGEFYYSFDFANPTNHQKLPFIYNHKRHNELNANLILGSARYSKENIRANIGLMAGNYSQYNLIAEPSWSQSIYEANIGFKISPKHYLWLDAGIMPSHIGFESAISADCWTLTRSILAENSPYYETGLKMSYMNNKENLTLSLLVLNGWQKIVKPDYIQHPSFGFQLNYKVSNILTLNYSNFLGTNKPDSTQSTRFFHNFYAQYAPQKGFGLVAGFDIGTDKYDSNNFGTWFSPILICKYIINKKMALALRGEYYSDKRQILITTDTPNGFQVFGISSNFDFQFNDKMQWRIEGKLMQSKDIIFQNNAADNFSITTNLTIRL